MVVRSGASVGALASGRPFLITNLEKMCELLHTGSQFQRTTLPVGERMKQFIGNSNYYNQDINYAWVTDRVAPSNPRTIGPHGTSGPGLPAAVSGARRMVVARGQMVCV